MLDFMILGLPRSGTTWAANWLCTDLTHCIHDPLYTTHYSDLDNLDKNGKRLGVSCTGLYFFPDFVNEHPAKKLVIYRPLEEINESLASISLPLLTMADVRQLEQINGMYCTMSALFDPVFAKLFYEHLTGLPFDAQRHAELVKIEMQPKFSGLKVNPEVTRRLVEEIRAAIF